MSRVFGEPREQKEMRCPKCGGATTVSTVGSITQWLSACSCNLVEDASSADAGPVIHMCSTCGKRISAGRSGSLTQWVFRLDLCSCTNPKPIDVPSSAVVSSSTAAALAGFEAMQATGHFVPESLPGFISGQIKAIEADSGSGGETEALLSPDPDKFPLERYNLLALIGQGGSGTVYYCQDRLLNKMVAVKTLHTLNSTQLVAFQREARATSRLNHPNIIQVYDFGATAGGVPYMCMEFVNGMSLERFLVEGGPLSVDDVLKLFYRVCQGLAHAHANGILHRDIKSSNILVGDDGSGRLEAKVIDFGVAVWRSGRREILGGASDGESPGGGLGANSKSASCGEASSDVETASGVVTAAHRDTSSDAQNDNIAGSPNYMPPDQSMGFEYDERSEVYGLGCTLFEVLTGQVPFPGRTTYETMRMHAELEPPRLSVVKPDAAFPEELEQLVARCLKKSQAERFQSILELGEALLKLTSDGAPQAQPVDYEEELFPAPPVLAAPPTEKERRIDFRNGLYMAGSFLFVVIVLVGFFAQGIEKDKGPRPDAVQKDLSVTNMTAMLDTLSDPHFTKGKSRGPDWYCARGNVTDHDLKQLLEIPGVRKVSLLGDKLSGKGLKYIQDLPLTGLDMTQTNLSDQTMEYISKFPGLVELDIDSTGVTDTGLAKIETLQRLEYLSVGPDITDKGVESIVRLGKLHSLKFESCKSITARGIRKLAVMRDLQNLTLDGLESEHELTACLSSLPVLDCLSLENMTLDRQSFANVSKLQKLKKLEIEGCRVDPSGVEPLARLRIKMLKLSGFTVPESLWNVVASMKSIKTLDIRSCGVRDENLRLLSTMADLEDLNVGVRKVRNDGSRSNALTDNGMVHIKNFRRLRSLDLNGVDITDSGVACFEELTGLERLQLSGPGITDKGLKFLSRLSALKELLLFGCPNITEGGTDWLKSKLPDCNVRLKVGEHSGEGL